MGNHAQASQERILALKREYSTPYSAIVREDVVMGVSRYFLERWLPVLGASPAALVNTLRQLDYRCQGDTITISGADLAREASMSRRHLYKCFETPWLAAFVRTETGEKQRADDGTITQQANRYRVRMDDPLSPADADRLVDVLHNLADEPLAAAQAALEQDARSLWAADPTAKPLHFTAPRAITVRDVLRRAFPTWTAPDPDAAQQFAQCAEALHRHIVLTRENGRTSKVIVPQYFRRRWWPRLGHDLAWTYLWLRGAVYDNPAEGVQRDTCWVPALDTLLALIGRPREWWRRNVEKAQAADWSLSDFFEQIDSQKGRDRERPQWVARQFRVALDVPVAPEDQARYDALLAAWPLDGIAAPTLSATAVHTGETGVRHTDAHRSLDGPPQTDTPAEGPSATDEHTGAEGVRHIHAQGSATSAHSKNESVTESAPEKTQPEPINSQHPAHAIVAPGQGASAAGAALEADSHPGPRNLLEWLAHTLETAPNTPLYSSAPAQTWLTDIWPEPIPPHTPAWDRALSGALSRHDLLALALAIWADPSINHPPRYLSWLLQRWDAQPDSPPVLHWETWRTLAALPIRDWHGVGRQQWIALAPLERRALPFGLDLLAAAPEPAVDTAPLVDASAAPVIDGAEADPSPETSPPDGLDDHPNGGPLTMRDIWQATLGQLSGQLNPSTYANWVNGAQPLTYADGVLTVQARHHMACDWLTNRLNHTIQSAASSLAGCPITIRYTVPDRARPRRSLEG